MIDSLIGSKTRVKLLHLFLSNPNRAFYVREITRKVDEQINSVRRELANMLSIGIIKSDQSNNKLYYEVNQNYPYYEPLRQIFGDSSMVGSSADPTVKNDWSTRIKQLGDVKIVLFSGKLVHGSLSDVDVLIVGNVVKSQTKKFIKELEEDEGVSLSYTILSDSDFRYRLSIKDRFVTSIVRSKHTVIIDTEHLISTV